MPNMFRCVLAGGGGGNGADLIVTCSSNFAGSVITCTDGSSYTKTQTCPSSSPYEVTFESIPTGTYTISGVLSGQTYSTTKTILDFDAELNDVPDGATVTPTDDIQIWLHCANIWDKNYTTISQVLADASTLQALIASNNAADYMARSTTWSTDVTADSSAMSYIGLNNYCSDTLLSNSTWLNAIGNSTYFESVLNVKTPTMTSDTTPSGVASASSNWNMCPAYYAFQENSSNAWICSGGAALPQYLNYEFPDSIKVVKIKFEKLHDGNANMNGVFQESIDGTTYTDLIAFTTSSATSSGLLVSNYPSTAKKYYRFKCNSYNYNNQATTITKGQIYGRIDI